MDRSFLPQGQDSDALTEADLARSPLSAGQIAYSKQNKLQSSGASSQGLFVVNKDGVIYWSYLSPAGINPGADGILGALEALQSKKQGPQGGKAHEFIETKNSH